MQKTRVRFRALAAATAATLSLTACETLDGPNPLDGLQFFEEMSAPELAQLLSSEGPTRIDVIVSETDAGFVAREVEVKTTAEDLSDEERIVGRVAAVEAGALLLTLDGVRVEYNEATVFWAGDNGLTLEHFLAEIDGGLAEGHVVTIKAIRLPPDQPQGPDDPVFAAASIGLIGNDHESRLDINIDADNLVLNDSPPPDAWLNVLGLQIAIKITDGETTMEEERDDLTKEDFESIVVSANVDASTVTLQNGFVVRIVDETEISYEAGDRHRLPSIAAVAEALEAGDKVFTAGYGAVESVEPVTLVAIHIVFEVAGPPAEAFEGHVASVNVDLGKITLTNGMVVTVDEGTEIIQETDLHLPGLEAVVAALETDHTVVTWGEGTVVGEEPLTIRATHIVLKKEI